MTFEKVPAPMVAAEVSVKGLKGGHSGLEIDKGRGNAIKIINRVLLALHDLGARISKVEGGNKRNAIPRECVAFIYLPKKNLDEAKKHTSYHRVHRIPVLIVIVHRYRFTI
jgi:dipeptidase D